MTLDPSKRVTYRQEIARRLEERPYSEIDLILEEFGGRTTDHWGGDKKSYVIEMLRGADSNTLTGLAKHLAINTGPDTVFELPSFWGEGALRVFMSHLSQHKIYASELQTELARYGISAFVAHEDIEPTAEWQNEIEKALRTCEVLLAILHPGFHDSMWTDQEVGFGLGRGIPVFSIRLGTEPYGLFGRLQAFNGNNKEARAVAEEIFDRFRTYQQLSDRMADVVVEQFAASGSFEIAKRRCGWLEELSVWKPAFKEKLRTAVSRNNQISQAWHVPHRVEAVIAKHDPDPSPREEITF